MWSTKLFSSTVEWEMTPVHTIKEMLTVEEQKHKSRTQVYPWLKGFESDLTVLPVDNKNLHDKCHTNSDLPLDCKDLKENCQTNSGVYVIYPYGDHSRPVRVFCDMETMDGGWTAIQKRINGSLKFSKNWAKYKDGFGAAEKDYWIGNDVIRQLTKGKNSGLYVSFKLTDGSRPYEVYDRFWISSEAEKYKLNLRGDFRGTLGDSMMKTGSSSTVLNGMFFSTSDRDNDRHGGLNCADLYKGGWWFNSCHRAFLNGKWLSRGWEYPWSSKFQSGTSVRETIMMIKRH
ncbi:ficolin-1-like [Saccostrea echinata]|uniref:ficolin-1-like n=1 Tax=Saccostrea echinata TaxID=191078 RepID=UPI002A808B1C|nr:ficolin-1-like [Saccostrea echinata]